MTRYRIGLPLLVACTFLSGWGASARAETGALNVLTWCDHEDPALLEPFEKAHNVKVHYKDIDSTGAALAVIQQSHPGDWDVLVLDETDTGRLADMGLLSALDPADFPMADLFEGVSSPALNVVKGKMYSVPEKFGYNAVAYDSAHIKRRLLPIFRCHGVPNIKTASPFTTIMCPLSPMPLRHWARTLNI